MTIRLKLLLFTLSLLFTNSLLSQLDSLTKLKFQYENENNDTLLFDVVQDLIKINTKQGNLKNIDTLYMKLDSARISEMDLIRQSNYYTNKVQYYGMRRRLADAQRCVQKAITLNQDIKDTSKLIINYGNLATIQMMRDKLKDASITYFSALKIATSQNDTLKEAKIYSNLSGLYYKLGAYDMGIEYANQSISKTSSQDYSSLAKAYTNLSINLYKSETVSIDSVITIMQKSIKLYEKVPSKIGIAKETNNIGTLLWKASRFEEAISYLKKAEQDYLDIDKEALWWGSFYSICIS